MCCFKPPQVCGHWFWQPQDTHCSVSLRTAPHCALSQAGLPLVITGCLHNNEPPDWGERLARHTGAPSVWGSWPTLPRSGSVSHTHWPLGEQRQLTHLCAAGDLHVLPGHSRASREFRRGSQVFRRPYLTAPPISLALTSLLPPPRPPLHPHPAFKAGSQY